MKLITPVTWLSVILILFLPFRLSLPPGVVRSDLFPAASEQPESVVLNLVEKYFLHQGKATKAWVVMLDTADGGTLEAAVQSFRKLVYKLCDTAANEAPISAGVPVGTPYPTSDAMLERMRPLRG